MQRTLIPIFSYQAYDYLILHAIPEHKRKVFDVYHTVFPDLEWHDDLLSKGPYSMEDAGFDVPCTHLFRFCDLMRTLQLPIARLSLDAFQPKQHVIQLFLSMSAYECEIKHSAPDFLWRIVPQIQCTVLTLRKCDVTNIPATFFVLPNRVVRWVRCHRVRWIEHQFMSCTEIFAVLHKSDTCVEYVDVSNQESAIYLAALLPMARELHLANLQNWILNLSSEVQSLYLVGMNAILRSPAIHLRHLRMEGASITNLTATRVPELETVSLRDSWNKDWTRYPKLRVMHAQMYIHMLSLSFNPELVSVQVFHERCLNRALLKTNPKLKQIELIDVPDDDCGIPTVRIYAPHDGHEWIVSGAYFRFYASDV